MQEINFINEGDNDISLALNPNESDISTSDWEPDFISDEEKPNEDIEDIEETTHCNLPRTENETKDYEIQAPLPFQVAPSELNVIPVGKVQNIIDSLVIVEQKLGSEQKLALDLDSILVLVSSRVLLGRVVDTFGPVKRPLYAIKVSPEIITQLSQGDISLNDSVGYLEEYSQLIKAEDVQGRYPGCDASNIYDEEVPLSEQEASDDEKETNNKKRQRNKRGSESKVVNTQITTKAPSFDSYLSSLMNFEYEPLIRPSTS